MRADCRGKREENWLRYRETARKLVSLNSEYLSKEQRAKIPVKYPRRFVKRMVPLVELLFYG